MSESFWEAVNGLTLRQGDYIPNCLVPLVKNDFEGTESEEIIEVREYDLIVLTQSCDIENGKAAFIAGCPVFSVSEYEAIHPQIRRDWNTVRKGQFEGLHLLSSPENPSNNRDARVVVFREIYSLPIGYLAQRVKQPGVRWRLRSPYLEHFSQAFARFFMRVGLPSSIPQFK